MIRPASCVLSLLTCVCMASAADDVLVPPPPFPIQPIEMPPANQMLPPAPTNSRVGDPLPSLVVPAPAPTVVRQAAPEYVQPYYAPSTYTPPAYVVPMTPQLPIWTNPPRMQSPAPAGSLHDRYPYYSYRRPWYTPGPASLNATIVW